MRGFTLRARRIHDWRASNRGRDGSNGASGVERPFRGRRDTRHDAATVVVVAVPHGWMETE